MRRWNGWGEESVRYELPRHAEAYLAERLGSGKPHRDVRLEEISSPAPRLPEHPLVSRERLDRILYGRGQSFPDLVALRTGKIGAFPDGVAFPGTEEEVGDLLSYARRVGARVIPRGGGTSVVGGVNPQQGDEPVLALSLERMWRLKDLDEKSLLATFGSGVRGPWLEAQLRGFGYTLGHYPQSFEYSTLGGWTATRSSGQQSLGYGRIEDLFRAGRVLTPEGPLSLPPFPASAAGPDLRHLVLGSEGRLGVITEAVVRVRPVPEEERFWGVVFPTWGASLEALREIVQQGVPLSMLRLSDPEETRSQLALALSPRVRRLFEELLARRGVGGEKSLLILAATGTPQVVKEARSQSRAIVRGHGGVVIGEVAGREWRMRRFRLPYLRDALWESGWATDTIETATTWSDLVPTARAILEALRLALRQERVVAMVHASHIYPTGAALYFTFLFRLASDPDATLERWRRLRAAAVQIFLDRGATLTHHHGIGSDLAPYLIREKGRTGTAMLEAIAKTVDPTGMMNPGKLIS
jgi:alkyldihydroxyacetonephosphate synthase